jgi:hypothetical protein
MSHPVIPEQLQIDAALSGRLWNLVQRFCGGAWGELQTAWTVSFEQIVQEAKRRDLNAFVAVQPRGEGYWLLETDAGYVVFYTERGARMYHEEFEDLEPAFRHWLDQELRLHLLPGQSSA